MIRVLLSDDEPWILKALQQRIQWDSLGLELVGTGSNGVDSLQLARELSPDLVITDVRMPGINGIELAETLKLESPDIEIILISGFTEFEYAHKGIEIGVLGYLLKPIQQEELDELLQQAVAKIKKKIREAESEWRNFRRLINRGDKAGNLTELLSSLNITGHGSSAICVITGNDVNIGYADFGLKSYTCQINRNTRIFIFSGTTLQCEQLREAIRNKSNQYNSIVAISSAVQNTDFLGKTIWESEAMYCRAHFTSSKGFYEFSEAEIILSPLVDDCIVSLDRNDKQISLSTLKAIRDSCRNMNCSIEDLLRLYNLFIMHANNLYRRNPITSLISHPIGDPMELVIQFNNIDALFGELHELLNYIISRSIDGDSDSNLTTRLREYIETHFSDDVHMDMLSDMFKKDKSSLGQKFRMTYDMSISEFLKSVRIRHAEYLLKSTELPVSTIADLCGYSDYYYFAKLFKKSAGQTCSQYRSANSS